MEELWKVVKQYWEIATVIFGLGVLWTNLQRDRKHFMERQLELAHQIEEMRATCEQHKQQCPAAVNSEIKAISTIIREIASDIAYVRGQIDGIKKG